MNTLNPDPWIRLIGRANEDEIYINGKPVTALLDAGSQVTHVNHDFCKENGIQMKPINQIVNEEGHGGDSIYYLGYIEATLSLPSWKEVI